jgi:hypothetical protein
LLQLWQPRQFVELWFAFKLRTLKRSCWQKRSRHKGQPILLRFEQFERFEQHGRLVVERFKQLRRLDVGWLDLGRFDLRWFDLRRFDLRRLNVRRLDLRWLDLRRFEQLWRFDL